MAWELGHVIKHLAELLTNDPRLRELGAVANGIWRNGAPQGTVTPYMVISYRGAGQAVNALSERGSLTFMLEVKIVSGGSPPARATRTDSYSGWAMQAALDRLDELLDIPTSEFDLGVDQGQEEGANGYVRLTLRPGGYVDTPEYPGDSGKRLNHQGRVWTAVVRPGMRGTAQ